MSATSLFEYSTAFKGVSAETKKLCEDGHSNRLQRRDPAMYGDHHKCNKCEEPAKYIAKDTHWCRLCIEIDARPELAGKTIEDIDQMRVEAVANAGGAKLVNTKNYGG